MWESLRNIYDLGLKELWSLRSDLVMCVLIVLSFTVFIILPSKTAVLDTRNASVGIVDEDRTTLSRSIIQALRPPYFKPPALLDPGEVDTLMRDGKYTFVIWIPHRFQADMVDGKQPTLQLLVDATAMSQAGNGASYIIDIINNTLMAEAVPNGGTSPIQLTTRIAYNPNLYGSWFFAITNIINVVAMLAVVLTGAALIRERERGTVEHLLVMPLRPVEIALSKVWANSVVIIASTYVCLFVVVQGLLDIPLQGSFWLLLLGVSLYVFSVSAIGIFLGTIARSMPQFGLFLLPVVILIVVLSGGLTPQEAMPESIQYVMMVIPSSHFTHFLMAVLFRNTGFDLVWQQIASMSVIGALFLAISLMMFRASISASR